MANSNANARAQAEILASVAQHEKDQLISSAHTVQSALHDANHTLSHKQRILADTQRDIASTTVERTKLMSGMDTNRTKLEEEIADQQVILNELHSAILQLEEGHTKAKQQHGDASRLADQLEQRIGDLSGSMKQLSMGQESAERDHAELTKRHKLQINSLSESADEKERGLERLGDAARKMEKAAAETDRQHISHVENLKGEGAELRSNIAEMSKLVEVGRSRLEQMQEDEEEAARRRRKTLDEQQKQEVSARKAHFQETQSKKQEEARRYRAATTLQCEKLRVQIDDAIVESQAARESTTVAFEKELKLYEEIRQCKADLVGIETLSQRNQFADAAAETWSSRCASLESALKHRQDILHQRVAHLESLKIQVAPLPEIESAIASHNDKLSACHKNKAELEAERAIANVQRGESEDDYLERRRRLQTEIMAERTAGERCLADTARQRDLLESDNRIMEGEQVQLMERCRTAKERNEQMDQTLEHVARQRRAMAEELIHRRDAARLAAQTLLAQLE